MGLCPYKKTKRYQKALSLPYLHRHKAVCLLVFPIVMYGCESWTIKKIEMLLNCGIGEASWESLNCEEIKLVNSKGNQSRIFIGRTDAEALILWPPDAKSQLIRKDPDTGKDWGQEEKRVTEDKMVGWHHQLNGHESEQTLGDSEGQESWAYCSSWDSKESDTTDQINNMIVYYITTELSKLLLHAPSWMNLKNVMFIYNSLTQKNDFCLILFL